MKTNSKNEFVGARLPAATVAAVDALAARNGITRTDAINQILIAGLDALSSPRATAHQDLGQLQIETVLPPKLSLLVVEIATRLTLLAKQQGTDMSRAPEVRAAYKKEFL